jgi:hypothetical protein
MQFVQKWWRKRPYTLCRSCRGIGDLQLCYSPLGPLLLKNFGVKCSWSGPSRLLQVSSIPRSRPRATSRAVATRAAPPTHRAQLPVPCCDRRSHGLHAASAGALDDAFTAFLTHPARATRTPAALPGHWCRRRTPSHAAASPCTYLDVRGGGDFFTKVPRLFK